jgi:hypothetical protein
MYDSITATDIPTSAAMVAGYINGTFAWSAADWARFPHSVKVRIATRSNINDGHVLDVEAGDATPAQAPVWVHMRRAAGVDPSIYCGAAAWPDVKAAFTNAGVAQPHYWIAHYDGVVSIPAGAVAKQYDDPPHTGGHYDLSIVADHWPGVDPATPPPPPEVPEMEQTDALVAPTQGDVSEALAAVLGGITGVRSAGPLAVNAANAASRAGAALDAVTAVGTQVTGVQNTLGAHDVHLIAFRTDALAAIAAVAASVTALAAHQVSDTEFTTAVGNLNNQVAAMNTNVTNMQAAILAALPQDGTGFSEDNINALGEALGEDVVTKLAQRLQPPTT